MTRTWELYMYPDVLAWFGYYSGGAEDDALLEIVDLGCTDPAAKTMMNLL